MLRIPQVLLQTLGLGYMSLLRCCPGTIVHVAYVHYEHVVAQLCHINAPPSVVGCCLYRRDTIFAVFSTAIRVSHSDEFLRM